MKVCMRHTIPETHDMPLWCTHDRLNGSIASSKWTRILLTPVSLAPGSLLSSPQISEEGQVGHDDYIIHISSTMIFYHYYCTRVYTER